MRGRKRGGVRHEFGIDRRAKKLGKLHQLGMGAALRHCVARNEERTFRLRKDSGRRSHRRRIGAQPRGEARRRQHVDLAFVLEHIAGERQEYRPGRRRQRGLGGAVHEAGQIGEPLDLRRPFHQRARQDRQVGGKNRLGGEVGVILLAGGQEDGRAGLLRVVEHAHGVAEAGGNVEIGDRELA